MDRSSWQQVRELFDAVCELEPSRWQTELSRLSVDPEVIAETLELLHAQTRELDSAREPFEQLLGASAECELGEGDRIGPWQLRERLARGGMGIVFRAERADELYTQVVAIKFLQGRPSGQVAERLASERRILASLQHPNIARLYDGGTTPAGQPYLVMEYVEGEPLDVYCVRHQLSLSQRLTLFLKVCSAVQAAHARLVLHCDLKPANILVRADGEPVLLDFGVSRLLEEERGERRGQFFTPAYAAPELQTGQPVGVTGDVFSLGCLLLELLAGKGARRGSEDAGKPAAVPSQVAGADCLWPKALRGDLDAIVTRAGALPPEERYPSVEALAADVQRFQHRRPVQARNGGRLYRSGRWLQRNWKGVAILIGVLLLAAWFVWRLAVARAEAQREAKIAEQVSGFLVSMFEAADPSAKGARGGEDISAREVLDRAAERVDRDLDASPEVRARLKGVIGLAYRSAGDLVRASPMLQDSADALVAAGGTKNIDEAAKQLNLLAGSYSNNRDGAKAIGLANRALALMGPQPADSFRVAQSYNSLGLAYLSEQRYADAEANFKQALQRHEMAGRDQYIGVTLDNLGMMYRRKGDLKASAAAFDRSTPMFRRMYGEMSYDFWASNTERTLMVLDRGEMEAAIASFEANLARAPKIFGEHSIYVVSENNRLALALLRNGEYERARPYVATALRLSAEVMGEQSYNYSLMLETAAMLAASTQQYAQAEADYRRLRVIREQEIGLDHPDTLDAVLQLGMFLARQGKPEGDALVQRAHAQWLARIPADSANGIRVRQDWAEWLTLKGRFEESAATLQALEPVVGYSPHARIQQQVLQAELAQRQGQRAATVRAWEQVVASADGLYSKGSSLPHHWRERLQAARLRDNR